jgi:quinol monooxygenase YgiN
MEVKMKYIVVVRGKLKGTPEQAHKLHDEIVAKSEPLSKSMGNVAHMPHLNVQNKNEFLSVDAWDNMEGIQKLYNDPALGAEFAKLFEGMPEISIWADEGWKTY